MIQFNCPHCRKSIKSSDELAGKQGKCPKCNQRVQVPTAEVPHEDEILDAILIESVDGPVVPTSIGPAQFDDQRTTAIAQPTELRATAHRRKVIPLAVIAAVVAALIVVAVAGLVARGLSIGALAHTIRSFETPEAPNRATVSIEAVLTCPPEAITEDSLRQTINHIHRQARATTFSQHDRPTLISIRLFTSANRYDDQYIAEGLQSPDEPFEIWFDQRELADLRTPAEVKAGLTEEQRRAIYWELYDAEIRASLIVNRQIPEYTAEHRALEKQLIQEFEEEIRSRHSLSEEQVDAIDNEASQFNWTRPRDY